MYKRVFRIFFFCLELICQNQEAWFLHSQKPGLSIIEDLNKIKKTPNTSEHFANIERETSAKFQQKILLNSTLVGARQSFQFFRQTTWFLGNKRALPKFKYRIWHHLISIIKLQNN